jgi:hypothetical protein
MGAGQRGIRIELRSIIRQHNELRKPFGQFMFLPTRPVSGPRYRVIFDRSDPRKICGLRAKINVIKLPDEDIHSRILHFAQSVWQLKDRLGQWAKATAFSVDVDKIAQENCDLLVCADLANQKKHGRNENRSGLAPRLGLVKFDTSKSGVVEFFYDGAIKKKEIFVTEPEPIPFSVDIENYGENGVLGDAVEVIYHAFLGWLPLIRQLKILAADDRESQSLRKMLYPDDGN